MGVMVVLLLTDEKIPRALKQSKHLNKDSAVESENQSITLKLEEI